MKKKFFIFIFFVFFAFLIKNEVKAYSSDPKEFIKEIVVEAKEILVTGNSKKVREEKLSAMALKVADIKGIGYYTLGAYRKKFSEAQLEEYAVLFEKYFLKSFTSRLSDYSDPKIEVLSTEVLNDKYTIVKSLLLATDKKPEVKIDWRVYTKNPDKPLIRDLIVEGLSLARTQKEEFSSILSANNNDIGILISELEKFNNN